MLEFRVWLVRKQCVAKGVVIISFVRQVWKVKYHVVVEY